MAQEQGSGDFVAGFLFGALVGAGLALLFAPAPGEETRGQIRDKGIELRDRAGELGLEAGRKAEELRARGEVLLDEQRVRFEEAIEEGRRAASRRKEELLAQLEATSSASAADPGDRGA